ncbi:hypothetical protein QE439_004040 [Pedobacter agri]|nr:hypothetical protein [Pedobacter agri]
MEYSPLCHITSAVNPFSSSNFLASSIIEIKRPGDCSLSELYYFFLMLKKGNKVSLTDLSQKIYNCEFLGFCYLGKRLAGISAIKRPSKSYVEYIHTQAGLIRHTEDFIFELGYSFTDPELRRIGISSTLKGLLQDKIMHYEGMIFSTTATVSSQRYLKAKGFNSCGKPYQGNYDNNIIYFEKPINHGYR